MIGENSLGVLCLVIQKRLIPWSNKWAYELLMEIITI